MDEHRLRKLAGLNEAQGPGTEVNSSIIRDIEKQPRGSYAGSVGYFSLSGDMDMCITIRTIIKIKNEIDDEYFDPFRLAYKGMPRDGLIGD